jgi:hypothetical protein
VPSPESALNRRTRARRRYAAPSRRGVPAAAAR